MTEKYTEAQKYLDLSKGYYENGNIQLALNEINNALKYTRDCREALLKVRGEQKRRLAAEGRGKGRNKNCNEMSEAVRMGR